ncbi:MAG TPA: MFS transporter [Candidatus Aphodovivens avistercoris]|nr:MFS transporter [Candidatus Aphodovivens avistercoris]
MTTANSMKKGRLFLALLALFLSSMCTLGDLVVSPITANLYEVFAGEPEWLINFGVTGPALVGLPFGILAGLLCDRVNKKWVMVVGFAIFTVSAVFGAVDNIYLFVVLRCCATGVGWGITNTAALSILAELFTDEDEHGKYVGWYNSVMSIMGALMSAIAGILAVTAWQNAFYTYLIAVPVLVMLIVFLPNFNGNKQEKNAPAAAEESVRAAPVKPGWWKATIPLAIQVFFIAICYFVLLYMIAVYVTDAGVGDEAFIGMITSVATICTAITSALFGFFYKKMKNFIYVPTMIVLGLVFLGMGFFPSAAMTVIGVAVGGLMWPFYFCYFYVRVAELVPASKVGTATSIVAFADGLAAAGSSYLLTGLMGSLGMTSVQVWPIFGVTLIVVVAISMIWVAAMRKKTAPADAEAK